MMMTNRRWLGLALAIVAASTAHAQTEYPSRPVRLIATYPAGGPADIFARALASKLSPRLGQPVVVEDKAGASGMVGVDYVAKSPPDGYTLVLTAGAALVVAPSIADVKLYDSFKDLAPITIVTKVPEAVVAIPSLGVHTLAELVTYAKAHPGQVNFASAGNGGLPHLAGELLKREAKIDIVHVPYRGAAPAVNELLGGHVQMMFADLPPLLPHIESGKLVPLALGSTQRAPTLPNVPTTAEVGYPTVLADNWYGLLAPGATPLEIVKKLNATAVAALREPDLADLLAKQGAVAVGDTPEEFLAYMRSEAAKWAPLAKSVGATLD